MQRDPPWFDYINWSNWRVIFWWFRVRPTKPPAHMLNRGMSNTRLRKWLGRMNEEMATDRVWAARYTFRPPRP